MEKDVEAIEPAWSYRPLASRQDRMPPRLQEADRPTVSCQDIAQWKSGVPVHTREGKGDFAEDDVDRRIDA